MRESYDVYEAAGRLKVSVAAWRWATASGLVPPADIGRGEWSRAVVEAADPEAVRVALSTRTGSTSSLDREARSHRRRDGLFTSFDSSRRGLGVFDQNGRPVDPTDIAWRVGARVGQGAG